MRIVLDALSLIPGELGGGETYIIGLICGLAQVDQSNEYVVLVSESGYASLSCEAPNFRYIVPPLDNRFRLRRVIYEQTRLPGLIKGLGGADVVHFLGNMVSVPVPFRYPTVVTVHDLSPFFYLRNFPGYRRWTQLGLLIPLLLYSVWQADAIITDSEFSRKEIQSITKKNSARIEVVPLASRRMACSSIDTHTVLSRYDIKPPYVLALGTLNKHKNLDTLVTAFARAQKAVGFPHHLVIGGKPGTGHQDLQETIAACGMQEQVHLIGYVAPEDLASLYHAADLFVMPSLYEGFGIPALEAMQMGIPTLLSSGTSLSEVGGGASKYCDPRDPDSIAQGIEQLLTNTPLRRSLARAGLEHVEQFSWEETARATVAVYEHTASSALSRNGRRDSPHDDSS